jgi:hypothetical protein
MAEMRSTYRFLVRKSEEENEHVVNIGGGRIIKLMLEKLGVFVGFYGHNN